MLFLKFHKYFLNLNLIFGDTFQLFKKLKRVLIIFFLKFKDIFEILLK